MKTFLRRWWILNRLFHFSRHEFNGITESSLFVDWMVGLDIRNRKPDWYTGSMKTGVFHKCINIILANSVSSRKHWILPDFRAKELGKLIEECVKKGLINQAGDKIELSPEGLEQYSISSIFFKSFYGKKIFSRLIEWSVPLLFIWIASNFFDIVIQTK